MRGSDVAERGFRTAFRDMCRAANFDDAAVQLSNALHHLYRLSQAGGVRYGGAMPFYAKLYTVPGGEVAGAVLWARSFDTHEAIETGKPVAEPGDRYSDYYTNLYGVLVWKPRAQLPPPNPKYPAYGRDLLYDQHLDGKAVLDTTQVAFRALLDVLS
jgi:hypothetical protein